MAALAAYFTIAPILLGGIDKVIPVDVYVPGCAARPEAIIDAVVLALGKLKAYGK